MGHGPKRSAPLPPPPQADTDLTGNVAMAAQQHAQFRALAMQGLRSTFLTSLRGTDGAAGAGLSGPPQVGPEAPLIASDSGIPWTAAEREARAKLERLAARAQKFGSTENPVADSVEGAASARRGR